MDGAYCLFMPGDLTSPRLMYVKAALFVVVGVLASAGILVDQPSLKVAGLLGVAVWAFARAYTFVFYVVHQYIDRGYRVCGVGGVWGLCLEAAAACGTCIREVSAAPHVHAGLRVPFRRDDWAASRAEADEGLFGDGEFSAGLAGDAPGAIEFSAGGGEPD